MFELSFRLTEIEGAFARYDTTNEELLRYFPVALIACVEAYFRMVVRQLVDDGEPYLANAERLSAVKLDFDALRAIHGKSVTVGELIAHAFPLSRLDHVGSAMSSLLGIDFLRELRTVADRWEHEIVGKPKVPILADPDLVYSKVSRAFELRHIICHEIASAYPVTIEDVSQCVEGTVLFLRASDELISEHRHPGSPLTQTDMNIDAGQALSAARKRLAELIESERAQYSGERLEIFDDAQTKWTAYCEAWSKFEADECAGGTIWPMLFAGAAESLTNQRIEEVESYRKRREI
jgi:uncharacterized protein YecT (DUF1311 family)